MRRKMRLLTLAGVAMSLSAVGCVPGEYYGRPLLQPRGPGWGPRPMQPQTMQPQYMQPQYMQPQIIMQPQMMQPQMIPPQTQPTPAAPPQAEPAPPPRPVERTHVIEGPSLPALVPAGYR